MTEMLRPDLLDRRALTLLHLVDPYGRDVDGSVAFAGDGVVAVAKGGGRFAVLALDGLADYTSSFDTPTMPVTGSVKADVDITPFATGLAPRRLGVSLPRDPNPTRADDPASLFQPILVDMPPAATATLTGGAGAVRVTVVRADDKRRVEHALVRVRSDNGTFEARALTDAAGEACVIFPALPLAFPGAGASVVRDVAAHAVAHADPASALFHADADLAQARAAAAARRVGHADPDAIAAAFAANFPGGTAVRIAAGRQPAITIEWHAP